MKSVYFAVVAEYTLFLWEGLEADIRIFMRILLALESRVVYIILNDKFYEI